MRFRGINKGSIGESVMILTVEVEIADDTYQRLETRERERGGSLSDYARAELEKMLNSSMGISGSFTDILAPVRAYSREMGYTEEEIGSFVDEQMAAYKAERRAAKEKALAETKRTREEIMALLEAGIITQNLSIVSGAFVFTGTRVPIYNLWDYLAAGDSLDVFLESFPTVPRPLAERALDVVGKCLQEGAAHP